jgi:hypothetical protein
MARCANCGRTIAFGGIKDGERKFCGKPCRDRAHLSEASTQLPDEFVFEKAQEVHGGNCPKCGGAGPVDVHTSHTVWSAGLITRWAYKTEVCCRACDAKAKLRATAFSGLLGWWGFPWGLLMTPAQIIRNIGGLVTRQDPSKPSGQLVELVRKNLSARLIAEDRKERAAAAVEAKPGDFTGAA